MPRFVARPVVVEAHQHMGNPFPTEFMLAVMRHRQDGGLDIATSDGPRQCHLTDWVFRDWNGTFHVMNDAMFEAMFEEQQPSQEQRAKRPYTRREQVNA